MSWFNVSLGGHDIFLFGWQTIAAAVAAFIIGGLWYGPLFGMKWAKYMGMTKAHMEYAKNKGMAKLYFFNFIGTLITASILGGLVFSLGFDVMGAIGLAIWLWLGFMVFTTLLGSLLWENKPTGLFWINSIYWLITFVVMAGILAAWM